MNKLYQTEQTTQTKKAKKASFVRYIMLLALLLGTAATAKGQSYVFLYKEGATVYFLSNNSNAVDRTETFNTSTCIFTGTGTTSSTFYNGRYLQRNSNTLRFNNTSTTWTITTYGRVQNSNRYIRYYNNGWTSLNNTSGNDPGTTTAYTVLFTYSNPTLVTISSITGDDVLTTTGSHNYSATGKAIQFHQFDGYSGTTPTSYYWYESLLTEPPTPTSSDGVSYSWSLNANGANASVNNNNGTITVNALPASDVAMTLTCTASKNGESATTTKTIYLLAENPSAPVISLYGTNQAQITCPSPYVTIYYTVDGSTTPTVSNGIEYSGPFNIDCPSTTVKAVAIRNDHSSTTATEMLTCKVPKPVITMTGANATIALGAGSPDGTALYYTTDGTTPTSSSTPYTSGTVTLTNTQTIKVIAIKSGYDNSEIASADYIVEGVVSGLVVLDDREPHSWAYYSDYDCPIRSLGPADVKITYYGNGTKTVTNSSENGDNPTTFSVNATNVKVSPLNDDPDASTFVYYKTLERTDASTNDSYTYGTAQYLYKTIPNPFSVRPTVGDANKYRGFYKWRIKTVSGGTIKSSDGNTTYSAYSGSGAVASNNMLDAEQDVLFVPSTENGMTVELEALWAQAYVATAVNTNDNSIGSYSVGYERNFLILAGGTDNDYQFDGGSGTKRIINVGYSATISSYYPDGTAGRTGSSVKGKSSQNITLTTDTKFEYVKFSSLSNYSIIAAGNNLVIGRGCSGTVQNLYGQGSSGMDYMLRIESGIYTNYYALGFYSSYTTFSGTNKIRSILGCDYDRALGPSNGGNDNLTITGIMYMGQRCCFSSSSNGTDGYFKCWVKSGDLQNGSITNGDGGDETFYLGTSGSQNTSKYIMPRYLYVEGGQLAGVAGGLDDTVYTNASDFRVYLRMTGGYVRGCVYGAGSYARGAGERRYVITGGEIGGWVAAGCNGIGSSTTNSNNGAMIGDSYVYIGGNAAIGYKDMTVNSVEGGNVFGAGRGAPVNDYPVGTVNNSNVVIADKCRIEKNVYGGGNYGYTLNDAKLYIVGGTVDGNIFGGANMTKGKNSTFYVKGGDVKGGVFGGCFTKGTLSSNVIINVSDSALVENGVFGGGYGTESNSCDVSGTVTITMTGGNVLYGLYGGGNVRSTISQNVTMQINGGQVGTSSSNANIHGGGYGANTRVNGNVTLDLGTCGAASGVTVYGDVYGGSAKGTVNDATTDNTTVSLYKGTIYGGLYGGGYGPGGENADVNGKVYVRVFGGSVLCSSSDPVGEAGTGSVFGCNNISGTPKSDVRVDIYNTDQPESGYALHAVYGGGNKSAYNGTPVVEIHGCDNKIDYVYGGGNATNVAGTNVTIWGGKIGNAFGGGNGFSETNNHTQSGQPHYNPGANILSGGTHLTIHGGTVLAAFGGSNQYGTITGGVNVNVTPATETAARPACVDEYERCAMDIQELYIGGNQAPLISSRSPLTYIGKNDLHLTIACDANVGMLFGGAKAADYVGDIELTVDGGTFKKVFGGNNEGGTITGNVTVNFNGGTSKEVYGGCNADGDIKGIVTVNIEDKNSACGVFYVENVYGGGNMAPYNPETARVGANRLIPLVNIIHGTVQENVYGGGFGSTATITGNPVVTVGVNDNAKKAKVRGSVFGGGNAAPIVGNTLVKVLYKSRVYGNIYGGGNQGEINGNTKVIVNSGN